MKSDFALFHSKATAQQVDYVKAFSEWVACPENYSEAHAIFEKKHGGRMHTCSDVGTLER